MFLWSSIQLLPKSLLVGSLPKNQPSIVLTPICVLITLQVWNWFWAPPVPSAVSNHICMEHYYAIIKLWLAHCKVTIRYYYDGGKPRWVRSSGIISICCLKWSSCGASQKDVKTMLDNIKTHHFSCPFRHPGQPNLSGFYSTLVGPDNRFQFGWPRSMM